MTRPRLMWSRTIISSARRTGSYSGSTAAATMIGVIEVTAAIDAARVSGEGR